MENMEIIYLWSESSLGITLSILHVGCVSENNHHKRVQIFTNMLGPGFSTLVIVIKLTLPVRVQSNNIVN